MALTALDIIVLLAIGIGACLGGMRGFVVEATSLLAWIGGILAVRLLHAPVSAALAGPVGTEGGAAVLAFAIVFGLTFLIIRSAGNALGKQTRASLLGPFDHVLGLGFGAVKGLLAATLAFLFVSLLYDTVFGGSADRPEWMTTSRTYPLLRASAAAVSDFVEKRREE
ncbi:MAG: CvpA family protein [Sphingomonadaceae bacterium]